MFSIVSILCVMLFEIRCNICTSILGKTGAIIAILRSDDDFSTHDVSKEFLALCYLASDIRLAIYSC